MIREPAFLPILRNNSQNFWVVHIIRHASGVRGGRPSEIECDVGGGGVKANVMSRCKK